MPPASPELQVPPFQPNIAIIGNDAVLAASPSTAVQLLHACLAAGFDLGVPVSWGDELIATETLRQLEHRVGEPAILCACPYVESRLLAAGSDLAAFLISLVAPPVAVARYLRAVYSPQSIRITYIGACPAGADSAIDVRMTPQEFFARLEHQQISLADQPVVFDSVVPPDRRRWSSLPGGLPDPIRVSSMQPGRTVIELRADDIASELAEYLLGQEHVLLDLTGRLDCVCGGPRRELALLEPPRSTGPVVEAEVHVALSRPLPTSQPSVVQHEPEHDLSVELRAIAPRASAESETPVQTSTALGTTEDAGGAASDSEDDKAGGVRRRTPVGGVPVNPGKFPMARAGERVLPRSYVGKRRTPTSNPAISAEPVSEPSGAEAPPGESSVPPSEPALAPSVAELTTGPSGVPEPPVEPPSVSARAAPVRSPSRITTPRAAEETAVDRTRVPTPPQVPAVSESRTVTISGRSEPSLKARLTSPVALILIALIVALLVLVITIG